MFAQTLQKILQRQKYIDQLSEEQIATIQTKEVFFKALEQSMNMDPYSNQSSEQDQKLFLSPNIDGPATNLLKHILPATQNSYEEIEQLQSRMSLFNSKKLNQVEIIKSMFEGQKENIKMSGLKVSDFLDLYEGQQMQGENKEINDPLIKKIMTYFQTNTKEYSLYELLSTIIEGLSVSSEAQMEESPPTKIIKKIRQSVCSLQGFNISIDDGENQFNEQTKKQMDKILSYYQSILPIFDIQNEE